MLGLSEDYRGPYGELLLGMMVQDLGLRVQGLGAQLELRRKSRTATPGL